MRKSCGFDILNFLLHFLKLGRLYPNVFPVPAADSWRNTSSNCLEHILGRIYVGRAISVVACEILAKFYGVATNVTKVNRFSTTLQEQEAIKTFK